MTWSEFFGSDYFQNGELLLDAFSSLYASNKNEPQYMKYSSSGKEAYLCDENNNNNYVHGNDVIIGNHIYKLMEAQ